MNPCRGVLLRNYAKQQIQCKRFVGEGESERPSWSGDRGVRWRPKDRKNKTENEGERENGKKTEREQERECSGVVM